MTVDIGFGCMAIDTSGVFNDFSRCTDFKSIVCQYPTPVASKRFDGLSVSCLSCLIIFSLQIPYGSVQQSPIAL